MKIYTKKGDKGNTSLLGGKIIKKSDLRVNTYGTVDELNSTVGIVVSEIKDKKIIKDLQDIQEDLLLIGSYLADSNYKFIKKDQIKKLDERTEFLERQIDKMQKKLPELKNFILPGGNRAAAFSHLARTVARRTERSIAKLAKREKVSSYVQKHLNRLSDYFFVLARWFNYKSKIKDEIWKLK